VRRAASILLIINLIIAILAGVRGLAISRAHSASTVVASTPALIDEQVKRLDLTEGERRWERVGWVYDVDRALQLSKELKRPILAYALNGRLDGRC